MGNQSNSQQNQLKIKILSVGTQSQQLFDFQSTERVEDIAAELYFPSCIAYNTHTGGMVYTSQQQISGTEQLLYKIQLHNYREILIQEMFENNHNHNDFSLWKVLNESEQYQIQIGDTLKIGKIKIKFIKIIQSDYQSKRRSPAITKRSKQDTERMEMDKTENHINHNKNKEEYQCRFCFQSTQTNLNPLVSVCNCSGSVKFIHYQCLKDWVGNNIKHEKSQNCLFYSYFDAKCQLCQHPIKNQFTHENKQYTLYQFQKVQPPYAVFQNRNYQQQTQKTRISIYLITLPQKKEITMGRNHCSKVVLKDISISRKHCSLVYRNGKLFIQDRKSKFGTLVCPQKGFYFDSVSGLYLQFQSKLIKISQQNAINGCCCASNNTFYAQINKNKSQKQLEAQQN